MLANAYRKKSNINLHMHAHSPNFDARLDFHVCELKVITEKIRRNIYTHTHV